MCPAFNAAFSYAAGPYGVRRSGPNQRRVLFEAIWCALVFLIPSHDVAPYLPMTSLAATFPRLRWLDLCRSNRSSVYSSLGHHSPDDARHLVGKRYSHQHRWFARQHLCQPRSRGGPLRVRHTSSLLAPMIRSRRRDRSPIFVVDPSRCLPPVECCRGASPSHAAKSRPRSKVSGDRARANSAVAINCPIPGLVINLRAVSSSRARAQSRS
jgi:hypothetical protein